MEVSWPASTDAGAEVGGRATAMIQYRKLILLPGAVMTPSWQHMPQEQMSGTDEVMAAGLIAVVIGIRNVKRDRFARFWKLDTGVAATEDDRP